MMNEDKRKEAQNRLTEEERVRRLQEGGESMKAQLAMEEAQRSSRSGESRGYLTPQEQERREMLQGKGSYRGYGESQQAEMAMWKQERERRAATDEELRLRERTLERTPSDVDRPKMESGIDAPSGSGFGMVPAAGMRREAESRFISKEEMRRTGSDQVNYPAGGGSYYSESFDRPMGTAGPESSFGRTERTPSGRQYAERGVSREGMRETGSDRFDYPAGGGSYYSESFDRPIGTAGPESSFGRTERMPSGRQYAQAGMSEQEIQAGRMGERPTQETASAGRMGQATGAMKEKSGMAMEKGKEYGGVAVSKGKEVSSTVVSKTRGVTTQLSSKAKEFNESNRAEDIAGRAGESIGRAIRKTVAVAKEMTSGLRRGMEPREKESRRTAEMEPSESSTRETVERREYVAETPRKEEKKYQEIKKEEIE